MAIAKRAPERHDVTLRKLRKARADAGLTNAHHFVDVQYIDKQGQKRPMIEVSEVALPLVLGRGWWGDVWARW